MSYETSAPASSLRQSVSLRRPCKGASQLLDNGRSFQHALICGPVIVTT